MYKFRHTYLSLLLLATQAGCFPFSAVETLLIVSAIPLPYHREEGKIDLSDYSIGPVSSGEFRELVSGAYLAAEGAPFAKGWAQWTGLKNVKQSHVNQSVAVLTDSEISFFWWHESRERYERLIQLPYADFHSVGFRRSGPSVSITFCHKNTEILIGDKAMIIDRQTLFGFKKSESAGDWEKTEQAFLSLKPKIQQFEGAPLPGECEGHLASGEQISDS